VDTATYASATTGVSVNLGSAGVQNTGGAGVDTLTAVENLSGSALDDTLSGNNAANVLDGGAGNDTLDGGAADDTLKGGAGRDVMTGGTGNDLFVFGPGSLIDVADSTVNAVNFGAQPLVDRINDFDANPAGGQDLIDLSAFGITSANFNTRVNIVNVGAIPGTNPVADTLLRIAGQGEIWLDGIASNTIDATDFLLA